MFFRSFRERICLALLTKLEACCVELLPTASQPDEPKNIVDLKRRAHELALAVDAAANAGDWTVIPALESRRQELDEELNEAQGKWFAEKEAILIEKASGPATSKGRPGPRLFATQARLNFAFAKLYMRLAANQEG